MHRAIHISLIGPAGSGKTRYAQRIKDMLKHEVAVVLIEEATEAALSFYLDTADVVITTQQEKRDA